jgi:hypothetical protein
MKRMIPIVAAGVLFATAGLANAAEPLSAAQMDGITAGASAIALGNAAAAGNILTSTYTATGTLVDFSGMPAALAVSGTIDLPNTAIAESVLTSAMAHSDSSAVATLN